MTRRKIPRRDKIRGICAVVGVVAALAGISVAIRCMERQRSAPQQAVHATESPVAETAADIAGYERNPNTKAYLFLGVLGDVLSTQRQQIALAHAYGDGLRKSCRNAVSAVSHLLGDCEIEGYYALNMGGISTLVDSIGGITVTIPHDYTNLDPAFVEGARLNLDGAQAYKLLRTRHGVDDQTNIARMARQNAVLEAATQKLTGLSNDDLVVAFSTVSDYAVTDMGSAEILQLKEIMGQYQQLPSLQIEGEAFIQGEYMAFEPDAGSLQDVILQLFYTKKEMR